MAVYLNGTLVEADEATVSVFDHGLTTGDGVFESIVVRRGRPFALERHLERLGRSAAVLGLVAPPADELSRAAHAVLESTGIESGKIRITLTGGPGPLGSGRGTAPPTIIVACEPLPDLPATATVVIVPWPRNEKGALAGAKSISYGENVVAFAYARERGASEAVFRNLAGNLCEGTGSNVFVGIEGVLVTPPLSAGCLAGVTRGLLLELTGAVERDVSAADIERIDEAFLTSTTRGVQPVETWDGRKLACPGPLTVLADEAFTRLSENAVPPVS